MFWGHFLPSTQNELHSAVIKGSMPDMCTASETRATLLTARSISIVQVLWSWQSRMRSERAVAHLSGLLEDTDPLKAPHYFSSFPFRTPAAVPGLSAVSQRVFRPSLTDRFGA